MHEVAADEAREGERAVDDPIVLVGEPQQYEGDERDRDLDADGILGGSEEVTDFQGLFDPSKEQLDGPYTLPLIN